MTIYLRDRIYIPLNKVDTHLVEKMFTKEIFQKEATCEKCPYYEDRVSESCYQCSNYNGTYKLYKYVEIEGEDYVGLPMGAQKRIKEMFPIVTSLDVEDERPDTKFKHDIKFTRDLYDYQVDPVGIMVKKKYGILQSPARSGKSPMAVAMMCKIQKKTLIIAAQHDWLEQFYETIMGSDILEPFTNIPELEKETGKTICGFAKTEQEFKSYDVVLCTYQMFLSDEGKKLFRKIRDLFSVICIDEVQRSSSDLFAKILSQMSALHKYGLSATPTRKDQKHVLAENIIGPVQHIVKVETLTPRVEFTKSGFSKEYKTYTGLVTALSNDKKRNDLIIRLCEFYYSQGHSIVIPVLRTAHVKLLVDAINKLAGKEIAIGFTGKLSKQAKRDAILGMRSRKYRILIGQRSIIGVGINIPILSVLLEVMPIANPENLEQESSRILTPMKDKETGKNLKPDTIIHYIVDDAGSLSKGCLRICVLQTHKPLGHKISKENWKLLQPYLYNKRRYDNDSEHTQKSTAISSSSLKRVRGLFSKDKK